MIHRNPKPEDLKLTNAINRILDEMDTFGLESPEQLKLISQLERLTTLQCATKPKKTVSYDQLLLVGGNLMGILVIVAYEQKHAMVSKATTFILKSR